VPSQNLGNDTSEGSEIEMNNQIILMGLAMTSLLLVGLPKAFAVDQPGCNSNGGSCGRSGTSDKSTDSKPKDTGPTITQKEIDHPKTIHIAGQNKCQTLDGFSASEPCPSSSHHSGHSHSNKHQSTSSENPKVGPLIPYNNPDYKISLQYPSNWKISEENLRSHQVVTFSAPEITQKLTKLSSIIFIPAQFGIAVEPLPSKNSTILQYVSQFFNSGYHGVSNYKIVNSSRTMLGGVPGEKIIMYDYLNNHTSEVMRIIGVENGTAYRIAYYAEPGTFSTYLPVIEQMIASFRINTQTT
jgi:hypothetical protein